MARMRNGDMQDTAMGMVRKSNQPRQGGPGEKNVRSRRQNMGMQTTVPVERAIMGKTPRVS